MSKPNRIREVRTGLGLTQKQVADMLSTTQSQIDRLEKGQRKLTFDWLEKIALALDVPWPDLIEKGTLFEERTTLIRGAEGERDQNYVEVRGSNRGRHFPTFNLFDTVIGQIRKPYGLRLEEEVWATYLPVSNMAPRWMEGEPIFFQDFEVPAEGDFALLNILGESSIFRPFLFCKLGATKDRLQEVIYFSDDKGHVRAVKEYYDLSVIVNRWRVFDWPELLRGPTAEQMYVSQP